MSTQVLQSIISGLQVKINNDLVLLSNNQATITDLTSKSNTLQQEIQDSQALLTILLTL